VESTLIVRAALQQARGQSALETGPLDEFSRAGSRHFLKCRPRIRADTVLFNQPVQVWETPKAWVEK